MNPLSGLNQARCVDGRLPAVTGAAVAGRAWSVRRLPRGPVMPRPSDPNETTEPGSGFSRGGRDRVQRGCGRGPGPTAQAGPYSVPVGMPHRFKNANRGTSDRRGGVGQRSGLARRDRNGLSRPQSSTESLKIIGFRLHLVIVFVEMTHIIHKDEQDNLIPDAAHGPAARGGSHPRRRARPSRTGPGPARRPGGGALPPAHSPHASRPLCPHTPGVVATATACRQRAARARNTAPDPPRRTSAAGNGGGPTERGVGGWGRPHRGSDHEP
jgi:hypothetical protein